MVCPSITYTARKDAEPAALHLADFLRRRAGDDRFYGVIALLLLSLFGLLAPYALDQQFLGYQLLPPSWSRYGNVSFFLGTDDPARHPQPVDRYRRHLRLGAGGDAGRGVLRVILGVFAGVTHGLRSAVLNHILDTLLSIPSLLLAIVVVAFIGPNLNTPCWRCGSPCCRAWCAPSTARCTTSWRKYVVAARLDGASTLQILWYAVMPNIAAVLVTEFTRALSMAILDIAALGFLDLGAQLPSPEWGAMLGDSLELVYVAPWTVMLPGAAILVSVLLVNLLGDGMRRAINAGVE